MPRTKNNSTIRRGLAADARKRNSRIVVMRRCEACTRFGAECVVTPHSLRCTECDKFNRKCDLAPPGKEYEKIQDVVEKLDDELLDLQRKAARLRRTRKMHLRKLKEMGDLEAKNILELEEDERRQDEQEREASQATTSPTGVSLEFADFANLTEAELAELLPQTPMPQILEASSPS